MKCYRVTFSQQVNQMVEVYAASAEDAKQLVEGEVYDEKHAYNYDWQMPSVAEVEEIDEGHNDIDPLEDSLEDIGVTC